MNFLFYGLGGDFSNWTTEAQRCQEVVLEIEVSGASLTIRREVSPAPRQAMQIYYGGYEVASVAPRTEWKTYSYAQLEQRDSFSTVLFKALGFPEVRTETDNSLTMHQLLRLLYIDQDSPIQNLFRFERFDPPLMKQAIAELLLGIYDDSLYADRIELRSTKKDYDEKERELKSLVRLTNAAGGEVDIGSYRTELANVQGLLAGLNEEISELRKKEFVKQRKNSPIKVEQIRTTIAPVTKALSQIDEKISAYELEIFDSRQFVESLQRRVHALDDSVSTRLALGEVPLKHCPECLHELDEPSSNGNCVLCKHPLASDLDKTQAKRLRQELDIQIRESKRLLEERQASLASLVGDQKELSVKARMLQQELDVELTEFKSTRDHQLDELLVKRGALENMIEAYSKQLRAIEVIEQLRKDLADLSAQIDMLKSSIQVKEQRQEVRERQAMNAIQVNALRLLRADLDRQQEFKTGLSVEIDFPSDHYSLDGVINFSASSTTYLKNAVRYAIFFASLREAFFRYPRLIICDNMEDKGMEQVRTQNFQKVIVAFSEASETDHQIIFSTSMVNPELDNEKYCVGDSYTHEHKTILP